MRILSVAHVALVPEPPHPTPGGDVTAARFWPVEDLALEPRDDDPEAPPLAFDHARILHDAVERVGSKLEYTTLATAFVSEPFSLADLRRVYRAVWGNAPDVANFRRKVLSTDGFVIPVEETAEPTGRGGRPAMLYRAGPATFLHPAMLRSDGFS
jgi:8-oxo-dGTP diphosphatase